MRILGSIVSGLAGIGNEARERSRRLFFFRLVSLPIGMDSGLLLGAALGSWFVLYNDMRRRSTFLITGDEETVGRMEAMIPGLAFEKCMPLAPRAKKFRFASAFEPLSEKGHRIERPLENMFSVLGGTNEEVFVSFFSGSLKEAKGRIRRLEDEMSAGEIRITRNFGARGASSGSVQSELYHGSDEKRADDLFLENLQEIIMGNGFSYRVTFASGVSAEGLFSRYLSSKLLILEEKEVYCGDLLNLCQKLEEYHGSQLSQARASRMIQLTDRVFRSRAVFVQRPLDSGREEIVFGSFLEGSVRETGVTVSSVLSSLNLGTLVTGLPGSGKTYATMDIVEQVLNRNQTKVVVVAPTEEWVRFGVKNNMRIVKISGEGERINFFRCPDNLRREGFYENLAMLMAHASNSGPYKNAMEKCLLSSFRRVYSGTGDPDPTDVYREIEEAVAERHGHRNNAGVKYTKHGENIIAGLQSLRLLLMKPQFAYKEGACLESFIGGNVVFDLSNISNSMKPFFYALVLNQIYAHSESLDLDGNGRLRLLVCLEEAQLIFDDEEVSAATMDLKQRIQDFRKKGVGIMLITHGASEINLHIRRLCQNKLYFRQSSDSARHAVADLIFDAKDAEALEEKLKSLEHRICALSYVNEIDGVKSPAGSLFVKTRLYTIPQSDNSEYNNMEEERPPTIIRIIDKSGNPLGGLSISLRYVGESVGDAVSDAVGEVRFERLLKDKEYAARIGLAGKKMARESFRVIGGGTSEIVFERG